MDSWIALLVLACLIILVLGPAAFFMVLGTRTRLDDTRRKLQSLEGRLSHVMLQLEALRNSSGGAQPGPEAPPAAPDPGTDTIPVAGNTPEATVSRAASDETISRSDQEPDEPKVGNAGTEGWQWPGQASHAASSPPGDDADPSSPTTVAPASSRPGLEERLGTRWTVWVGGIALGFGALLMVRYAIDQGFFGPGARVVMGLALAILLIAAGEKMRRKERAEDVTPRAEGEMQAAVIFPPPSIPAVLTAAGTVAAFGSLYAAHALYGFIGPALAFIALGAAAIATMFAAALHGPMLAGLGLAAALGVPVLVSSAQPSAWPVTLYLAVTAAAAYALARLRGWLWLAIAAAAGAALWCMLLVLSISSAPDSFTFYHATLIHLLIQSAMAIYVLCWEPYSNNESRDGKPALLPTLMSAAVAATAAIVLAAASGREFSVLWAVAAAAIAAMLAFAGLRIRQSILATCASALLIIGALLFWPWPSTISGTTALQLLAETHGVPQPLSPALFGTFAALASIALASATLWKVLRNPHLALLPVCIHAGTAVLTPMAALLGVYLRYHASSHGMLFATIALLLALAFATCAQVFRNGLKDAEPQAWNLGQGITASGAIAALAIGLTLALDGGTLTIALALAALGAAFVAVRLEIAALRWCVAGLGIVLALRFLWEPGISPDISLRPIFNWLLAGYGIPALCFGLAARMMRRAFGEDRPVRIAQAMTILFSAALVYFEIRHYSFGGDLLTPQSKLVEQGLLAIASFAFAIVLMRMDKTGGSPVFRYGSYGFGLGSVLLSLAGLGLFYNPLLAWRGTELPGGVFFNPLLLSYLLPGLMALLLGRMADGVRPRWYVMGARITAMALVFGYITMQVRRVFQGPAIGLGRYTSDGEWYTYSAVWLVFGICLLAYGLWRKSVEVRIASALVIVLSVVKVFLFDLAGLDGILRALSFIGLGGVLIGIGLVYQKYVFARPAPPLTPS